MLTPEQRRAKVIAKARALQKGYDKAHLFWSRAEDPVVEFMKKLRVGERRKQVHRHGRLRPIPPRAPKREIRES